MGKTQTISPESPPLTIRAFVESAEEETERERGSGASGARDHRVIAVALVTCIASSCSNGAAARWKEGGCAGKARGIEYIGLECAGLVGGSHAARDCTEGCGS
jgi:hypothetical protein